METIENRSVPEGVGQSTPKLVEYSALATLGLATFLGFTGLSLHELITDGHVDGAGMKFLGAATGFSTMGYAGYKFLGDFLRSSVGWGEPNEN